MKKIIFISISMLAALTAYCQTRSWSAGIFYDQDYTLEMFHIPLNEDRNYTMGLGLFLQTNSFKKSFSFKPLYLLNKLFNKSYLNDKKDSNNSISTTIMLANGSFTPDSLSAYYPIYNDRPYGSLTYLEFKTSYVDQDNFIKTSSSFDVGVLGTYISREAQTYIHVRQNDGDTKNPHTPRGWHHQISDGGELTLMYAAEKEKLLTKKYMAAKKTPAFGLEFKHGYKYSIGYYTLASYDFSFRAGWIDPRQWTYTAYPLANSSGLVDPFVRKKRSSEVYFYGTLKPGFILYNALLNGQFRHSDVTVSFEDTKHFVVDGEVGLAVIPRISKTNYLTARIRFSGRSPEIKFDTRPERFHYWGGIDVIFNHY